MARKILKRGIDVSKHQGVIDWQKVKAAGIQFVMIRVGYRGYKNGAIVEDPYFKRNITGALAAGIAVGAYFFSTALTVAEAEQEARYCIEKLKGYDVTLPVVFDFEGYDNKKYRTYGITKKRRTACCKAFNEIMTAAGYSVMLYGSKGNIRTTYNIAALNAPLWIARYAGKHNEILSDDKYFPTIAGYTERIAIWQYTSVGRVDGIRGNADMNFMYIDVTTKKEETKEETGMGIYTKGKAVQLSKNFKSTEFDCNGKGCCTTTPIDPKLVEVLQNIRDHFAVFVHLNCGYRCPKHNAAVSGASARSKHMEGLAADIVVRGVHPVSVARYIETIPGFAGRIGCYTWDDAGHGFVHVDVRGTNSRGIYTENNTKYDAVVSFSAAIRRGSRGRLVKVMQRRLKSEKLYAGLIDGKCGTGTVKAIQKWNEKHGRANDLTWGPKCWGEAFPV